MNKKRPTINRTLSGLQDPAMSSRSFGIELYFGRLNAAYFDKLNAAHQQKKKIAKEIINEGHSSKESNSLTFDFIK
jgi:hypothetical protein